MFWVLTLLFLIVPALEIWLLDSLPVSVAWQVAWCALTALAGAWPARSEGLSLWSELESDILNHRLPTPEGVDAMLLVLGGWLLIVPGMITDTAGALLILPFTRQALVEPLRGLIRRWRL